MKRLVVAVAVIIGILGALVTAGFVSGALGQPLRYEIADGFTGWATISYGDASCAQLERRGLFLVIPVDVSGKGCTSGLLPSGWRFTKYVRVRQSEEVGALVSSGWADEASRMIWAGAIMTKQGGYDRDGEYFFVGTSEELKAAWSKQPVPHAR